MASSSKPRALSKEVLEKRQAERQTALNPKAFDHGACALCLLKTHCHGYDCPLPSTTKAKGRKGSGFMASEIAHQQPTAKDNRLQFDARFCREYLSVHEYLGPSEPYKPQTLYPKPQKMAHFSKPPNNKLVSIFFSNIKLPFQLLSPLDPPSKE